MKIKEAKVNGLRTYFVNYPGAKSASVQYWFRAGSSLETGKDLGIAHFLEHMFFKGTKTRPGSKIAHEIESYGGEINAFTSFDYTCYYINTPKKYLAKSVEILSDMVANPMFLESELVPERGVVFEEYRRSIDNPHHFHFHNIQKNSFSKGYNHPILGFPKTINNFQRNQLINFRKKYYNLSNTALIITGELSSDEKIKNILKKYKLPKGPKTQFKKFGITGSDNNIHINNKDISQATLTITIEAPDFEHKDAAAEDLALNCLCHGETSYLRQALVVQSSLATTTASSTMFMNKGGAHFLKVTYPCENHEKVLNVLHTQLKSLAKNLFSEQDVEKIKNQYIASKIYEKESVESFSFSLGHSFAQNENLHSDEEFIEKIKTASTTDVNSAFLKILKRKNIHYHLQLPLKEKKGDYTKDLKQLARNNKTILKSIKKKTQKAKSFPFDKSLKQVELRKGVHLLHRHNPTVPTSVIHSYIKGGLSHEDEKSNGSHYMLSKLFTYGNKETQYKDLKLRLENYSASMSGFSGKNAYGLTMHCLTDNLDQLFNDFFDTLFSPSLESKYLKLEKEIVSRYLEQIKIDPIKQCFKTFQKNLFHGHGYAQDIMGTSSSLNKITSESLLKIHQSNLHNNEILFTYCGDKSIDWVLNKIEPYLDDLKDRSIKKSKLKRFKFKSTKRTNLKFNREQTQIFIGFPGLGMPELDDKYLRILTNYLSGQSSELFVEVRDRQGLCYSTQPVHHSALEGGYWGIYIGAGADKVDKAIKAIMEILNRLQKEGLPQKEISRVQKMLVGYQDLQLQSNEDFANYYSIPTLHGHGPGFENEMLKNVQKVKEADMKRFLKSFLSQEPLVVTAGP